MLTYRRVLFSKITIVSVDYTMDNESVTVFRVTIGYHNNDTESFYELLVRQDHDFGSRCFPYIGKEIPLEESELRTMIASYCDSSYRYVTKTPYNTPVIQRGSIAPYSK